jgi:hypothetical protein
MLKTLEASQYLETQITGLSQPAQLRCGKPGNEIDLITKFKSSVRNREVSLGAEVICALMARDLGFTTPEIYLVEISRQFAETVPGFTGDLMRRSAGLNFGSGFLRDHSVFDSSISLPEPLQCEAAEIFAFDVILQNFDRQSTNPNLLYNRRNLVLIDHESAFSPVLRLNHFALDTLQFEPFYQHVLFPSLNKTATDYSGFASNLQKLTTGKLSGYIEVLPDEWKQDAEAYRKIADYLEWVVAERNALSDRILELLG